MGFLDYVASASKPSTPPASTARSTSTPPATSSLPPFDPNPPYVESADTSTQMSGQGTQQFLAWQDQEYNRLLNDFQVSSGDAGISFPGYYGGTYDGTLDFDNVYPRQFVDGQRMLYGADKEYMNPNYNVGFAEAIEEYYTNDDRRGDYQMLLYYAGYLDKPPANPGAFNDSKALSAWERAVRDASFRQESLFDMLTSQAQQRSEAGLNKRGTGTGTGSGSAGPKRPTVQTISDEDAQEVLNQIATNELGRELSESEAQVARSIIKAMQTKQASEQNAYIDQAMKGGGTVQAQTDPRVTATSEVETRFSDESGAYDLAEAFANLIGMSGG